MGGGDLNLKKSWHPNRLKNQEEVWKKEQAKAQEDRKLHDLRKEIEAERSREQLREAAESAGVLKSNKNDKQIEWMYKNSAELINREEYLLGRTIDKNFEKLQEEENIKEKSQFGIKQHINHVEHDCVPFSIRSHRDADNSEQVDIQRKTLEDPLMEIKKMEMEKRRKLLDNPVKLKKLQELIRAKKMNEKNKRKKKSKKLKKTKKSKKKRAHSKHEDSDKDTDTDSDSSNSSSSLTDADLNEKLRKLTQKLKRSNKLPNLKKLTEEIRAETRHKEARMKSAKTRRSVSSSDNDKQRMKKEQRKRKVSDSSAEHEMKKRRTRSPSRSRESALARNPFNERKHAQREIETRQRNNPFGEFRNARNPFANARKTQNQRESPTRRRRSAEQARFHFSPRNTRRRESPRNVRRAESTRNSRHQSKSRREQSPIKSRRQESPRKSQREKTPTKSRRQESPRNSHSRRAQQSRSRHTPEKLYHQRVRKTRSKSKSKSRTPKDVRNGRKKGEDEKAARLREMMDNAEWRETDRIRAVTKHRRENEREEAEEKSRDFDKNFINKQVSRALSNQKSVGSRIRANLNNIQRSSHAVDSNFARK